MVLVSWLSWLELFLGRPRLLTFGFCFSVDICRSLTFGRDVTSPLTTEESPLVGDDEAFRLGRNFLKSSTFNFLTDTDNSGDEVVPVLAQFRYAHSTNFLTIFSHLHIYYLPCLAPKANICSVHFPLQTPKVLCEHTCLIVIIWFHFFAWFFHMGGLRW